MCCHTKLKCPCLGLSVSNAFKYKSTKYFVTKYQRMKMWSINMSWFKGCCSLMFKTQPFMSSVVSTLRSSTRWWITETWVHILKWKWAGLSFSVFNRCGGTCVIPTGKKTNTSATSEGSDLWWSIRSAEAATVTRFFLFFWMPLKNLGYHSGISEGCDSSGSGGHS